MLRQRVGGVEVADQILTAVVAMALLAVAQGMGHPEAVERVAVMRTAEEVGGADVDVGIGEAEHLAIGEGALEAFTTGIDGDFREWRATGRTLETER